MSETGKIRAKQVKNSRDVSLRKRKEGENSRNDR